MPKRKIGRRPKRMESQPTEAVVMALPMMKAIITQAIWSVVAAKAPCMCGKATPTEFHMKA